MRKKQIENNAKKKKINCSYCFKKNCSEFQFSNFNENDSRF